MPRERRLDVRAPPFYPSVAHASVAQAFSILRVELHAVARASRTTPLAAPRRTGGRQRRRARRRGRPVRECYVGAEQAASRFEARAEAWGWLVDGDGGSDYYSAEEG